MTHRWAAYLRSADSKRYIDFGVNSAFTHIDLCMSAIIISMNFLYCADRETRTLTPLLAPGPKPGVSTFHHIRIDALFGQYCSFPRVQSAKLFLEYHLGATQMIFTPQQVAPFGLAISLQGLNSRFPILK